MYLQQKLLATIKSQFCVHIAWRMQHQLNRSEEITISEVHNERNHNECTHEQTTMSIIMNTPTKITVYHCIVIIGIIYGAHTVITTGWKIEEKWACYKTIRYNKRVLLISRVCTRDVEWNRMNERTNEQVIWLSVFCIFAALVAISSTSNLPHRS